MFYVHVVFLELLSALGIIPAFPLPIDNDGTGRSACWALELDPCEWTVIHKDGLSHLNADAM